MGEQHQQDQGIYQKFSVHQLGLQQIWVFGIRTTIKDEITIFLGFMRLKGKNYGNFFIATQTMSGQVFVKKVTSKKWTAIKPVLIKMLNTPGFELTKR